jgi:hypothetical protein
VISLDPLSPAAHLNLQLLLADQQRSEDALAEFEEAVNSHSAAAPITTRVACSAICAAMKKRFPNSSRP